MSSAPTMTCECLPGYQFQERLGRGQFGEIWKAHAPGGGVSAVQFLQPFGRAASFAAREIKAAEALTAVRNPGLINVEKVATEHGRLVLVMDWAEKTLADRFAECQAEGKPGIPRDELIGVLRGVAATLDFLDVQCSLHHLALNPRSIWLVNGQPLLAEYGLAQAVWIPMGQPLGQLNPRYAAPELFDKQYSRTSDQYSLAVVYQEMLTATLPHRTGTTHQISVARQSTPPDLSPLTPRDRVPLLRALDRDPRKRFFTSVELMDALEPPAGGPASNSSMLRDLLAPPGNPLTTEHRSLPSPEQLVNDLVGQAMAESLKIEDHHGVRVMLSPDGTIQHRCAAWIPTGMGRQKLEGFIEQCHAQVVEESPDAFLMRVDLQKSFWQWVSGKQPAIEIDVKLTRPRGSGSKLTEVTVKLRYVGGKAEEGNQVMEKLGPQIIDSLRSFILAPPEQRVQDRFPFEHPVRVLPMGVDAKREKPLDCRGRDISYGGMSFYAPSEPQAREIDIHFQVHLSSTSELAVVVVPAAIRRVQRDNDGRYLVGIRFLLHREAEFMRVP